MQSNDHQPNDPSEPTGAGENPDQKERTRAGQIVQDLARVTRPMAALAERRPASQAATAAMRERVSALLAALGDPSHPLHQRAVDDLVTIGPAAVPQLCDALSPQRPWLTAY